MIRLQHCESLREGTRRNGDLRDHLCADQRPADQEVGFWDYARFGIPITILTTVAGVAVLLLLR